VADWTFTVSVQLEPAAKVVAPDSVKVPGLVAAALATAEPPQVLVTAGVALLTRPAG
jgi:hypothetical protein